MRSLLLSFALFSLASIQLTSATAVAQCAPYGTSCTSSGMLFSCVTNPVVGTNWTLGERSGTACGFSTGSPGTMFTLIGLCFAPGIPIDPPLACSSCGGCALHVLPALADLQWTWPPRTVVLTIPSDPNLVGTNLCLQDVCVNSASACVCLSGAVQVTFM